MPYYFFAVLNGNCVSKEGGRAKMAMINDVPYLLHLS